MVRRGERGVLVFCVLQNILESKRINNKNVEAVAQNSVQSARRVTGSKFPQNAK